MLIMTIFCYICGNKKLCVSFVQINRYRIQRDRSRDFLFFIFWLILCLNKHFVQRASTSHEPGRNFLDQIGTLRSRASENNRPFHPCIHLYYFHF